ncbi:MAG: eL32 family ribosomal protein [Nanoarchaeota archaeon]
MSKKNPTFLRSDTVRHLRLGKKRRKLQKWRRPRGHHSKIRLKRFSYPTQPGVGYGTEKKAAGKIEGRLLLLIHNAAELAKVNPKTHAVILARIGAKKKIELLKKAQESNIIVINAQIERTKA